MTGRIVTGNSLEELPKLSEASAHAVVTDPPYGLAFMGKDWDDFEPKEYQEWCEQWATEVKRVLKPGGHLLAFSGNRTHHRLFTGVEDAGFEIRDTLTWHYGSGFPKAADISKTIDKREGVEREVTGIEKGKDLAMQSGNYGNSAGEEDNTGELVRRDKPATDAAKKWDGFKTGLKPATEYVVMARKPFDGATVDCVLEHGTGALNIDECRINTEEELSFGAETGESNCQNSPKSGAKMEQHENGRYPSNVVFDETEAERLDRKNGESISRGGSDSNPFENGGMYADEHNRDYEATVGKGDSGGPSRYFYTSKASKSERTENGTIENSHPTVKPTDLMEWLVKLVTAEGQIVLDPFAGSGTTCKAAKAVGREFIGIEKQAKWADVARVRCGLTAHDASNVRPDDDAQQGLEMYSDGGER